MGVAEIIAGFPGHAAPACDVSDNGQNSALAIPRRGGAGPSRNFNGIVDMLDDLSEISHVEPNVVRLALRQAKRPPEGGLYWQARWLHLVVGFLHLFRLGHLFLAHFVL